MAAQLALKAGKTFWNEHKDISRIHNENLELFYGGCFKYAHRYFLRYRRLIKINFFLAFSEFKLFLGIFCFVFFFLPSWRGQKLFGIFSEF